LHIPYRSNEDERTENIIGKQREKSRMFSSLTTRSYSWYQQEIRYW